MTQPPPGPTGQYAYHPQPHPRRKGLLPLILGGLTLLVGTPLALFLPLALGMGDLFGAVLDPIEQGDTRYLPGGEERVLYAATTDTSGVEPGQCHVTGPQGEELDLHSVITTDVQDSDFLWRFTTAEAGDHTFDCGADTPMAVAPGDAADGVVTWALVAFGLGTLAFLIGLGLITWGIVQLIRTGKRTDSGLQQGPGGPAGAHGPRGAAQGPTGHPAPGAEPWQQAGQDAAPLRGGTPTGPVHAATGSTRDPHPLHGVTGRPAPQYGQYAPGHEASSGTSGGEAGNGRGDGSGPEGPRAVD
ncbi:hypothetical protein SAMN05445756_0985 [Kytococcus aerolatus]|uniref:Uncharacterized protein n=1 Tax=Kytococcus aerolatus TaxID=592308 RepID=A0A212TCP4_9MICO|nr:hypothetical protein [Kytococcus aerolatus]SNC63818.1 hypothetical protein SAMN05445756_0985 [Kytococcus aerolatus]